MPAAIRRTRLLFGPWLSLILVVAQPAAASGLAASGFASAAPMTASRFDTGRERDIGCLADAIYYEAANQPVEGRRAVAQVVLNRLKSPRYPKSVCGVVYQGAPARGCQFTFACDGSLARLPTAAGRRDAEAIAEEALDGTLASTVGASTHYHTLWVHPYWSAWLTPTVRIGAHQFYSALQARGGAFDRGRPAPGADALGAAPAPPQASRFSVWGLEVAQLSPAAGGVSVVGAGPTP